jgi:uncharacterized phage-associated protein
MITANDVARHLNSLAAADSDAEPMTPARLQKLLYYCQGWHLAWYGRPLFADAIVASECGPTVPSVSAETNDRELAGEARESVEQVWSHYRQFSAIGLREKAKAERPWKTHYRVGERVEIPTAEIAAFFGAEFRRQTGEEPGAMAEIAGDVATGRVGTLEELRAEWDR